MRPEYDFLRMLSHTLTHAEQIVVGNVSMIFGNLLSESNDEIMNWIFDNTDLLSFLDKIS